MISKLSVWQTVLSSCVMVVLKTIEPLHSLNPKSSWVWITAVDSSINYYTLNYSKCMYSSIYIIQYTLYWSVIILRCLRFYNFKIIFIRHYHSLPYIFLKIISFYLNVGILLYKHYKLNLLKFWFIIDK